MVDSVSKPSAVSEGLASAQNQMTSQLQEWLSREEYTKVLKFVAQKLMKNNKQPFYNTMKAYCLMKLGKHSECQDLLQEIKPFKQTDPHTIKYLVFIFTAFGQNADATQLLEGVQHLHSERIDLGEQLYFSYVREGRLLKQQNQALHLYKIHSKEIYAQWAIESMYLISLSLRFETKILDIAYLLLLKLMKEPEFQIDNKFIKLYLKVLSKQGKFKEAIDFIDVKSSFFEGNKVERQKKEAVLYHSMNNPVLAINVYFNMLRLNSNVHQYKEIWDCYLKCIRIILHDFLPRNRFAFNTNQEIIFETAGSDMATAMINANFEPISMDDKPEQILLILYQSLKNLRKVTNTIDLTQQRLQLTANNMRRTSYLAELELKYVYALHCKGLKIGDGTSFFLLMIEYIESFYDKVDVTEDLKPYLSLLTEINDIEAFVKRIDERVEQIEQAETAAQESINTPGYEPPAQLEALKLLRWKFVKHKICRLLGVYTHQHHEPEETLQLVLQVYGTFLQTMEHHPQATATTGSVGTMHSMQYGQQQSKDLGQITDLDLKQAETVLIIAVELMYEIKKYDWSVLNPYNFLLLCMLEHGQQYYPDSIRITTWLLKLYSKLGITKVVSELSQKFPHTDEKDYERLGGLRFSCYSDFGMTDAMNDLIGDYKDFYRDKVNENKNKIVTSFLQRNFDDIHPLMQANEVLQKSPFLTSIGLASTILQTSQHAMNQTKMHLIFNKQFAHVDKVCDTDPNQDHNFSPNAPLVDEIAKKNIQIKNMTPFTRGMSREDLLKQALLESAYETDGYKKVQARDAEIEKRTGKGIMRFFGYKHHKQLKFYGQLLRCLRDCYESKFEQLNIDMNFFLLLKNELSLHYLRNHENILATVKAAIRIHAAEDEEARKEEEAQELMILEKIIKNQPLDHEYSDEEIKKNEEDQMFRPESSSNAAKQQGLFDKIVNKLLEYNEKINGGREISVVEFLKRIDMNSSFMHKYENQKNLRRAFFEEFKIHCFNYVLLLFESIIRILTTINRDIEEDEFGNENELKKGKKKKDGKGPAEEKTHYYSKNYRRFLEHRQKKIDKFVVNCIGWAHVLRCVEVIEMAMRDLVYKIVPTKVVIRELKTSTGKVLTKDSEYTLVERKKYVTVGKKTQIDYVFELDLKEDTGIAEVEKADKEEAQKKKDLNAFFLNIEDFSLFKLRSAVFLIQFPVTFTMAIMNIWNKILPQNLSGNEEYSRDEIEQIMATKHAVKEFSGNMVSHIKNLLEYLQQVKKEKPLKQNYKLIVEAEQFAAFKQTMLKTKGTSLVPVRVEELMLTTYEKLEDGFTHTIGNTITGLEKKISQIRQFGNPKSGQFKKN